MVEALRLEDHRHIHLVGAGGAGMSGLAKIMVGMGHEVTGSDLKPGRLLDTLEDIGIDVWIGHKPERAAAADLLVYSSAVPSHDPELVAARDAGIAVWSRPDALDALTTVMPAIGATGTHGKTTSTAMLVTSLQALGLDPTFLVGGEMVGLGTGAHLGSDDVFALEADEAFGTFRRLHLSGLMVTNIEVDHLDYYGNVSALEEAFAQVAARVSGPVVGCIDDPGVRRLAGRADVVGYGLADDATWRIDDVRHGDWSVSFTLHGPAEAVEVTVPRPGLHIARNAAGVVALMGELGYDVAGAAAGLADYAGVRRRFEVRARIAGVTVVDDYAHHPTEVAATIAAARLGSFGRVWAVFQPHRYSRTAELAPSFGVPLATADRVVVTDIYAAGEAPLPGVSGRLIVESVTAAGGTADYVPSLSDLPAHITSNAEPGDLVLLLGAGDISMVADAVASRLGGGA